MFSKTLFVAAFAALSQMVVASPPGCMLGAINTYKNPADIKAVCQTKDITNQIVKLCGGQAQDALDAFADVCNGAGVTVSTKLPTTASGSASPTGTSASSSGTSGSANASNTGAASPTGNNGSPAASGTGSAAPAEASGGAATSLEISAVALLAGLGVVVAAL